MDLDIQIKAEEKERDVERLIAAGDNNVLKYKKAKISIENGVLKCNGNIF